jgi:hypothetical protein
LFSGVDSLTGKAIKDEPHFRPATDFEAQVIEALTARGVVRQGGTVGPDGTVTPATPGAAQSRKAGLDQASAFAAGIGSNPKAVTDAAMKLIKTYTDALAGASTAANATTGVAAEKIVTNLAVLLVTIATGPMKIAGIAVVDDFKLGIEGASVDRMFAAAAALLTTFVDVIRAESLALTAELFFLGRAFVQPLLDGVNNATETTAWSSAAAFLLNVTGGLDATSKLLVPVLAGIGERMTGAVAFGMLVPTTGESPGVTVVRTLYDQMLAAALELAAQFILLGGLLGGRVEIGFNLAAAALLVRVGLLPGEMAARLRGAQGAAVKQAHDTGEAIGRAINDGINSALGGGAGATDDPVRDAKGGGRAARSAAAKAADEASGPGVDIGKALIDGMILGMFQKLPELIDAAKKVTAAVADVIREGFDVHSPSRVTATIGEQVVEGLAVGMEAKNDRVVVAAQGLADRVTATIQNGVKPKIDPAGWYDEPSQTPSGHEVIYYDKPHERTVEPFQQVRPDPNGQVIPGNTGTWSPVPQPVLTAVADSAAKAATSTVQGVFTKVVDVAQGVFEKAAAAAPTAGTSGTGTFVKATAAEALAAKLDTQARALGAAPGHGVFVKVAPEDWAAATSLAGKVAAAQVPPPPPGATLTAPPGPATAFLATQPVAPAPTPAQSPQDASAAAKAAGGPYIHADKIEINGVPGADEIPQRTDQELWRLGYGESPRRTP